MKIENHKLKIFKIIELNYVLILIILLGALFRFYGLNWDQNQHLHPDERFLTMVGNAMKFPLTLSDYFNPQISTFNPPNIGFPFFVYGVFPLMLNKILAVFFNTDTYNGFTLQGRFLSGLADLVIVVLLYKTVLLFEEKYKLHASIKYLASFFYAIAVLPIQLSHFFAVDTFLNVFMFASFYFALRFSYKRKVANIFLSAIFFGLAISSKISAVFILPLIIFFLLAKSFQGSTLHKVEPYRIFTGSLLIVLYLLISYVSLRISNPYYFNSNNLLDPTINTVFVTNIESLKNLSTKDIWYPPAVQWITKPPILFSFANLVFFGVGLPYFMYIASGFYFIFRSLRKIEFVIFILWICMFFFYQSIQFGQPMRYFIFIYPFLSIFSGIGFCYLHDRRNKLFQVVGVLIVLIWPLAFMSIYAHRHSRVQASEWIYKNLENKSVILGEYWDDPLPLYVQNTFGKQFQVMQLPVFDPDTQEKWQKLNYLLANADYLVLSSNRGWGSIPTVPERYPFMSKFYQDLFDNRLSYKKIKEFTSYPSLRYLGIPIDFVDDWADESFTVYDHPRVIIFKKLNGI